jgi:hypothetical protein
VHCVLDLLGPDQASLREEDASREPVVPIAGDLELGDHEQVLVAEAGFLAILACVEELPDGVRVRV